MLFAIALNWLIRSGRLEKFVLFLKRVGRQATVSLPKKTAVSLLFITLSVAVRGSSNVTFETDTAKDIFPVPKGVDNQLFYLQRDPDANTVVYKVNVKNGKIDEENPVGVFWIRYAENGQIKSLSTIQKKLAYGVNTKLIEKGKHELRLAAYPKMPLYLIQSTSTCRYRVYASVEHRQMILNRIFVRVKGGSLYIPKVQYIELTGRDAQTGKDLTHRITI